MKRKQLGMTAALGLTAALALAAGGMRSARADDPKDIVTTAAGAPQFSTLVTAVKAAGLVQTLQGHGPFTVFAPTNEAFARIPKAKLDALLADPAALKA